MASSAVLFRSEFLASDEGMDLVAGELGTDGRYLLMVLIERFWSRGGVTSSVKKLAKELGLGETAFSHSVRDLIKHDLLLRTPHYKEGHRGRPWFHYDIAPHLRQMIRELEPELTIHHKNAIAHCCLPPMSTSVNLSASLTRREKVVLCTLLANADQVGVVKTKTIQELCQLTGMRKSKLENTLRRLIESGHIQQYIPGFSARQSDVFHTSVCGLDHRLLDRMQETRLVKRSLVLAMWDDIHSDLLLRGAPLKPINASEKLVNTPEESGNAAEESGSAVEEPGDTADSLATAHELYADMLWSKGQQSPLAYERILFSLQDHASALVLAHLSTGKMAGFVPESMMGLRFYRRVRRDFIPETHRTLNESGRYRNRKATAALLVHVFRSIHAISWSIHSSIAGHDFGEIVALSVIPDKQNSDKTIMVAGLNRLNPTA